MYRKIVKKIRIEREIYNRGKEIKKLKKNVEIKLLDEEKKKIEIFFEKYTKIRNLDWHEYYKNYLGFNEKNIPEDIYFTKIIPSLNNQSLRIAYADKNMYTKNFPNFDAPKIILRNINGVFLDKDYNSYKDYNQLNLKPGKYVIKPTLDTSGGKAVSILERKDEKYYLDGTIKKISEIYDMYIKDFIIQEKVKQSDILKQIYPNSLNTIRITTYRNKNQVAVLSAVLRVGNDGNVVDNASKGGLVIGINQQTGVLKDTAVHKYKYIKIKDYHPYTKSKFSGIEIPNFQKLIEKVKFYHSQIPNYFDLASFDMALDYKNEFIFIEVNLGGQDIDFHQKTNGPFFGEKTEEVLQRVFEKEAKNV